MMLSPHEKDLLTGYVDGELTARQRHRVERLLCRSEEARALLSALQEDARALQNLPRVSAPSDLPDTILALIAQKGLKPGSAPLVAAPPRARTIPSWMGYAAAAAVLLLVGIGSFMLHLHGGSHQNSDNGIASGPVDPPRSVPEHRDLGSTPLAKDTPKPPIPPKTPSNPRETDPLVKKPENPEKTVPDKLPHPREVKQPKVLASGANEPNGSFERVELALPVVLRLHELDKAEQSLKLLKELGQGSAFRIELPARDSTRGFDRLRVALTANDVTLLYDPAAKLRLSKPNLPIARRVDYALFVENLTPAEAARVLKAVGLADRRAGAKKVSELRFDGPLVIKPMSRWDSQELRELLGIDPVQVRPTPAPRQADVSIHRPLSELTDKQVTAALEGRGVPRPGTRPEITGYVAPLHGPRTRSAELKRFLDSRKPEQPGTIQLFIVVRNVL